MIPRALSGYVLLSLAALATGAALHATQPQRSISGIRNSNQLVTAQDGLIALTATQNAPGILVLDYGVETEGIPSFEVVSTVGDTSVFEVTYSETKAALSRYMVWTWCKFGQWT